MSQVALLPPAEYPALASFSTSIGIPRGERDPNFNRSVHTSGYRSPGGYLHMRFQIPPGVFSGVRVRLWAIVRDGVNLAPAAATDPESERVYDDSDTDQWKTWVFAEGPGIGPMHRIMQPPPTEWAVSFDFGVSPVSGGCTLNPSAARLV